MTPGSAPGELAVELAWSLWRELGVPAPVRRHTDWLVVPEPLILFTAALGDRDRRLRDVRLRQREELTGLLGEPPEVAPSWGPLLRLLTAIASALEDVESLPDDLAGAELHRLLR